jgi:lysophospholipase L1-like esterase
MLVAALTPVLLFVGFASPAQASPAGSYVAMGDSYSSGAGAGNYVDSGCARSANAYSALWAQAHPDVAYLSVACSGATTATLMRTQLPALTSSTTMVSLTIGGNDVGFADVLKSCYIGGDTGCTTAVDAAEQKANIALPGKLDHVFVAIKARSPHAQVVAMNYPDFYTGSAPCSGISVRSQNKINEGNGVLSDVIEAAAERNDVEFVDARGSFAQHAVCSAAPWIRGLVPARMGDSYHPTAAGHSGGYLAAFNTVAN